MVLYQDVVFKTQDYVLAVEEVNWARWSERVLLWLKKGRRTFGSCRFPRLSSQIISLVDDVHTPVTVS